MRDIDYNTHLFFSVRSEIMNKIIVFLLAAVLVLGLSACANLDRNIDDDGIIDDNMQNNRNFATNDNTMGNDTNRNDDIENDMNRPNGNNGMTNPNTGTDTSRATTPQDGNYSAIPPAQDEPTGIEDSPPGSVISTFSTPIKDYTKERIGNIKLCIKKLENITIPAGSEFSFNKTVGRRTLKKGYKKAIIFIGKEKVKEIGGGICQVSSTIYNAAMNAGFEITERHEHSLPVDYVEEGKDATVMYGSLDLKFRNNYTFDCIMEVTFTGKSVDVCIKKAG